MNPSHHTSKPKGFTLVEVMIAMAVGVLVLGAVAQVFVTTFRTIHKNQVLDKALTNSRLVQEHLNRELSSAISQTEKSPFIRPEPLMGTSSTDTSVTPNITYFSKLTYRVAVGSVATVKTATINSANSITITTIGDMLLETGDYLMVDSPSTGKLLQIRAVTGTMGTPGDLTLTLSQTIHDAEVVAGTTPADIPANTVITVQRERCYDVVQPAGAAASDPYELRWYENTASTTYVVLSANVDPNTHDLFARTPADVSASNPQKESSVKWRFAYLASASERAAVLNGSQTAYYQTNETEGMIMPKSGNPVSSSSYSASVLDRYSGLYSTTLLTTTSGTSTTNVSTTTLGTSTTLVSTSTAGTSTTLVSTTTSGTSTTLKSTTTLGTSTTLKSTTTSGTSTTLLTSLSTSTQGTSSTIQSTTLLTSLSTSTNGTSTTLKSTTTKGTSTTNKSTTTSGTSTTLLTSLSTTTSGTSTTLQSTTTSGTSTTRLTSLSTSTNGTSTTLKSTSTQGTSTTLKTTTAGTSSTLKSTTTAGTSTTLQSTSTNGTSSTLQSSTTTQITTTISYDG